MHVGRKAIAWFLVLLLGLARATAADAIAPSAPGTEILNVARLSYTDTSSGETIEIESNTSRIVVGSLRRFSFGVSAATERRVGESVAFAHRLHNTGNVADSYRVELVNALADDGDLFDLQLVVDANGNGLADADERPLDAAIELAPGESLDLVASGTVPPEAEAGALIEIVAVARSTDEGLAAQSVTDSVRVLDAARLAIDWGESPSCETGLPGGERVALGYEVRNASAAFPVAREIVVDGEPRAGVLIETVLPPGFALAADAPLEVMAFRGLALVRERAAGAGWMRRAAWNGESRLERVALLAPPESFARGDVVGFAFEAIARRGGGVSDERFVARVDLGGDGTEVDEAIFDCTIVDEPVAAFAAELRFVRPAPALQRDGEAPDHARGTDFVDATHYRLDVAGDRYRPTRDGVYVELVAAVSEGVVLRAADGTAHVVATLRSRTTGDSVRILLRETAPGSLRWRSVVPVLASEDLAGDGRFCPGGTAPRADAPIDYTGDGEFCAIASSLDDVLEVGFEDTDRDVALTDTAVVDPAGRVFDSGTLEGVAGARVTVRAGESIARDPLTGEPLELVSDKLGRYVLPRLEAGRYHLEVEPPAGYAFPSSVPPQRFESFSVGAPSYGVDGYLGESDGRFAIADGEPTPAIDVPLDPVGRELPLLAEKSVAIESVEPGESVVYRVALSNRGDVSLEGTTVIDTPPYGFRYVRGSARLDGEPIADPARLRVGASAEGLAAGLEAERVVASLHFELGALAPESETTLAYELEATAGALDGDGVNTAVASARTENGVTLSTSPTRARVRVAGAGVLSDRAILFGKVYVDASCDNLQNHGEWPIGGVRLYLEDGTFAITDEDGQFSLYGLRPGTRVLKLDPLTLPEGLALRPLDTRHAADPESRFVTLSRGDFHRADFAAGCPTHDAAGVLERLVERNRDLRGTWLLDEASRFDPDADTTASAAQRAGADGDLSSGLLGAPRAAGTAAPASATGGADDAFVGGGGAPGGRGGPDGPGGTNGTSGIGGARETGGTVGIGDADDTGGADGDDDASGTPSAETRPETTMGDPKALAATITAAQAEGGTWLWPRGEISGDGRFLAVVRAGVEPTLYVNGLAVPATQIGERIENRRERAQIVAWYGVSLTPGLNRVEVRAADAFGNERVLAGGDFKRPAAGVRMVLRTRQDTLPADGGRTMLPIDILITDANGYPASGVYFVTLLANAGSFLEEDLQSREPGVQVRVEDGRGKIHVRSSDLTGPLRVEARTGRLEAALNLVQVAAARPLVGAGLIEIGGRAGRVAGDEDGRADLEEGFDVSARTALFLKGRVRGELEMTLAYDTDKPGDETLLRDVDPRESYPTLGDASVKGFEARSRSKLYLRLERDRHSVMWGDYLTDAHAAPDDLARVQRTLTGLNALYDDGTTRVQGFAARQSELRASEEIRGNGTSMLFRLEGAPIVPNSEVIERVVRDRDNPGLVIETERLLRFSDYTLDAFTGLLSFADVVPSVDEALNPVFIRASYDRREAVAEHTVSGLRLQRRIGSAVSVGASLTDDANPLAGYTLAGVHLVAHPTPNTRLGVALAAQRHREGREEGGAARVQLEHLWGGRRDHRTLMSWARATEDFDNAAAGIADGRAEWRVEHHRPLGETLKGSVVAVGSDSSVDGSRYGSVGATLEKSFASFSLSGGLRRLWSRTAAERLVFDTFSLGAEKRFSLLGRQASVGADYERALADAGRYRYGVDARVQLHDHVTLYGRYERERGLAAESLLGEREGSRQLVAGIESDVLANTELYSEYRLRGAFSGRAMEAASGVRGRYELVPGVTLSPALERIDALGGDAQDSVALSLGISDTRSANRKLVAQAELRETDDSDYLGLRATLAERLNVDWTALLREEYSRQEPEVGELSSRQRLTLGLARRPKLDNRHHALVLASWRQDYGPEDGDDRSVQVLSTHHNRQIGDRLTVSGRAATKWRRTRHARGTVDGRAWLFDLRTTLDVARRFEVDLRGGWLGTGGPWEGRLSLGAGLSWIVDRNLRLGIAYNLLGFRDEDLDEQGYNARGVSFGLQMKFDEDWFEWLEN